MYTELQGFIVPERKTKIWRYMDFTKFMSLLDANELFFTRSDKFNDLFEGTYPISNTKLRSEKLGIGDQAELDRIQRTIETFNKFTREFMVISCWHVNNFESAAMWDLYLKSHEGIAIQSNVGRLIDSFEQAEEAIYVSKVNYIDFKTEWMPEDNAVLPYIHKRKSFEHECELRAIHQLPLPIIEGRMDYNGKSPVEFGKPIKCDVKTLIENIYIAPSAPKWFEELVESMCRKFDLNVSIIKSELSELPY
ncbi:hypothetical protein COM64_31205 [Bacillus toyonensis]|uniref:hypothetical protein n=1 Tax=Bacillus toyonensis TaxID=155322 RepID=UPI000BF38AB9|nr:hypothetical protein [Bacillus toyonensis]PGE08333.1 hypothetical protein COM64_31205 [Bacillus toyonensis]